MLIYLIGLPGVGKSTIGKELAKQLSYNFIDLDDEIEKSTGLEITTIFNQRGEQYFREIETLELQKTLTLKNYIIATGGGTPCFDSNMEFMNSKGKTIYLKAEPKQIFDRLTYSEVKKRPLFDKDIALVDLQQLYTERNLFYSQANNSFNAFEQNIAGIITSFLTSQKDY